MRELNYVSTGRLEWFDRPEPELHGPTDAIVRPFVVSRCDGDTLPIHWKGVTTMLAAGLRTGVIDPSVGHIAGHPPFQGPAPIGHEAIAEVIALGSDVTHLAIGDQVVVPWSVSCGTCQNCRRGLTSKCLTTRRDPAAPDGLRYLSAYGFGAASGPYGGMVTDLLRVPHADHMLVKLPDGLDPLRVAAASDNLADGWRAVVPGLRARPGGRVLIMAGGAKSIALSAAGLAVAHGASQVDYIDTDADRAAIAESFGARVQVVRSTRVSLPGLGYPRPVREGYDIVVEATSSGAGLRHVIRCTAPGGECTAVGYYVGTTTPVPLMHMYATDITLHLGVTHPRAVLPELLDWMATHDFPAERVTTTLADFDDAPAAYAAETTKLVLRRDPLHA